MLYAHSRRAARRDGSGRYVPLSAQDTALWDEAAIAEAEALLRAASYSKAHGRFQLEAAVQSVHAARRMTRTTDWEAISALYDALFALTGSPVVAVNRAAAVAQTQGAAAGLALLDPIGAGGGLDGFEPYWVARADLCAKLGASDEARRAYEIAIGLQTDSAARAFLIERLGGAGVRRVAFPQSSADRIRTRVETSGMITLLADQPGERAADVARLPEPRDHRREVPFRPPAELAPGERVVVNPVDAGRHPPAAAGVFVVPAGDALAHDGGCVARAGAPHPRA